MRRIAELEVGARVRRATAFAADKIVNPLLATSQYVGGLIGGIGMGLKEKTIADRTSGHSLGDNFCDYVIPVHADTPEFVGCRPQADRRNTSAMALKGCVSANAPASKRSRQPDTP